jgi:16S rRNA (uracil1498-N3)-methyltransferase
MNLILFEEEETRQPLPASDPRARHVIEVLRRKPGDIFDAGIIDGPRGKGTLVRATGDVVELAFEWGAVPDRQEPVYLLVGMPRPQTARRILRESTSIGVDAISFFDAEKGEPSYSSSVLWSSGEWRRQLIAGAEQAFDTHLPKVSWGGGLAEALARLPTSGGMRLALDVYEGSQSLAGAVSRGVRHPVVLAIGSERGWSAPERESLRLAGFEMVHLGERVLRTETALAVALGVLRASGGAWESPQPGA